MGYCKKLLGFLTAVALWMTDEIEAAAGALPFVGPIVDGVSLTAAPADLIRSKQYNSKVRARSCPQHGRVAVHPHVRHTGFVEGVQLQVGRLWKKRLRT